MNAKAQGDHLPKREQVYTTLRKQIYSGYLMPGSRLIELDLAERFGVSRTIIREVIKQLALEGLVEVVPYKGASVARMSFRDLEELYTIQKDLEGLAAYLATKRLTDQHIEELERIHHLSQDLPEGDVNGWQKFNRKFHRIFLDNCGNQKLVQLIENHRDHFARYWFLLLSSPGTIRNNIGEHASILDAVKRRKPLLVRNRMERHLGGGLRKILEILQSLYPDSPLP
jgi:DNA-binding GntR family transcriptional regulator